VTELFENSKKAKISVIVPTCREAEPSRVKEMTQSYPDRNEIEKIIVDSQSSQQQIAEWRGRGWLVEELSGSNRAQRLQKGYDLSTSDLVIFHHPRSLLPASVFEWLLKNHSQLAWGGFTHRFDVSHPLLKFTSFYSNRVRPRTGKIIYLDHCIFFRRSFLDRPIPAIPIFEDTEICRILARHGSPEILPFESVTSAIRFQKNGVFYQALLNQKAKVEYFLGRNKAEMNTAYEQGLNLNE
jgi:hypothetical protein